MTKEIQHVDVKKVWENGSDFIQWLKVPTNLYIFAKEIGFSLEINNYNFPKDKVDIDIIAKDDNNDTVLIKYETSSGGFNDIAKLGCAVLEFREETDLGVKHAIYITSKVDREGVESIEFCNDKRLDMAYYYYFQLIVVDKDTYFEPAFILMSGPEGTLSFNVDGDVEYKKLLFYNYDE